MGGWRSSCQLGLIVYLKTFPPKALSERCPQCKHSSEPLSSKADMLAGALLSLWRLTKVHAGEEARLYQHSETDGLQLITPLQSPDHMVSFRINRISKGVSGLNIPPVNPLSFQIWVALLHLQTEIVFFLLLLFLCNIYSLKNSNAHAHIN